MGTSAERLIGIMRQQIGKTLFELVGKTSSELLARAAITNRCLAIHLSQHNINTADRRHHVSNQPSFAHFRSVCKFANEGARTCTRYGFGLPSVTT